MSALTDTRWVRRRAGRFKSYVAVVVDAEGVTYEYVSIAKNRRHAEREVRESARRWGATLVGINPVVGRKWGVGRRELVVAGVTFGVSGVTITAMMIIGLTLEGAL